MRFFKFSGVRGWVFEPILVGVIAKVAGTLAFAILLILNQGAQYIIKSNAFLTLNSTLKRVDDLALDVFLHIIVSPIFENLVMVWLIYLVRLLTPKIGASVAVVAIISFFGHGIELISIAPAVGFAIYAFYYFLAKKAGLSWVQAYACTVVAHAASNLIAILAGLV
jgi:hypothetical protein